MNKIATMVCLTMLTASGSLLGLSGCAAPEVDDDQESVAADQEAFGETACGTVTADSVITHGGAFTSATTYSNASCFKSQIIDVMSLSNSYPTQPGAGVAQTWNDTTPTTQAACEAAVMEVDMYNYNGSGWTYNSRRTANGSWISFFGGHYCNPPGVTWANNDGSVINGNSYRFSVTARTVWSSGPTQAFVLATTNGFH
jgi:hypothetical protein